MNGDTDKGDIRKAKLVRVNPDQELRRVWQFFASFYVFLVVFSAPIFLIGVLGSLISSVFHGTTWTLICSVFQLKTSFFHTFLMQLAGAIFILRSDPEVRTKLLGGRSLNEIATLWTRKLQLKSNRLLGKRDPDSESHTET